MRMRLFLFVLASSLLSLAIGACSDDAGGGSSVSCVAGEARDCSCDGGQVGTQACLATEAGYTACDCSPASVEEVTQVEPEPEVVEVADEPVPTTGDLKVVVANGTDDGSGQPVLTYTQIRLFLYQGELDCDSLDPVKPKTGSFAQKTLPAENAVAVFSSLLADTPYTAFATGRDPSGHLRGVACREGIQVIAGETKDETLYLSLLNWDPTGCYTGTLSLGFGDALASQADANVTAAAVFLDAPDVALVEALSLRLEEAYGEEWGSVLDSMIAGYETEFPKAIEAWLVAGEDAEDGPRRPWLACLSAGLEFLPEAIANLEVSTVWRIDESTGPEQFPGAELWQKVKVSWPKGCQSGAICEGQTLPAPSPCKKVGSRCLCELPFEAVADGDWAPYSATMTTLDELSLASHALPMILPGLVPETLKTVLLPLATSGKVKNIEAALTALWDCPAIVALVDINLLNMSGVDTVGLTERCEEAVAALVVSFIAELDAAAIESSLIGEAVTTVRDSNGDLKVDSWATGALEGSVLFNQATGATYSGHFTANRTNCPQ
jgi:hypothetical protein